MRNPQVTRETILKKSGNLFNTLGYKSTSISQITEATGLTKGAIYMHFGSKEELECATLAHLSDLLFNKLRERIKKETNASDKLRSIFSFFETYITNPPLKGGCPLMNAAIESDDAYPTLRKEAHKALSLLKNSIAIILQNGIDHKQIKPSINTHSYATVIIACLEGSIMLSKLEGNNKDVRIMTKHLTQQLIEIEL